MLLPLLHDSDPTPKPSQASLLWGCRRHNACSWRRPEPCACKCTAAKLPPTSTQPRGRRPLRPHRPHRLRAHLPSHLPLLPPSRRGGCTSNSTRTVWTPRTARRPTARAGEARGSRRLAPRAGRPRPPLKPHPRLTDASRARCVESHKTSALFSFIQSVFCDQ